MAVQPDKRSHEQWQLDNGWNEVERHRIGHYTLVTAAWDTNPHSYNIRSDKPGFDRTRSISWYPHDGWVAWDGDDMHASRTDVLESFRWWVGRQRRSSPRHSGEQRGQSISWT